MVQGTARHLGCIHKGTVSLIEPALVGVTVIGHVKVQPAVTVEIGGDYSQRAAVGRCDSAPGGDVFERTVSLVAEKAIGQRFIALRRAVVQLSIVAALMTREDKVHVITDKEVQPTVLVIIPKRRAYAPSRIIGTGMGGDVLESAVPPVAE